jgi:hypothetical protein
MYSFDVHLHNEHLSSLVPKEQAALEIAEGEDAGGHFSIN